MLRFAPSLWPTMLASRRRQATSLPKRSRCVRAARRRMTSCRRSRTLGRHAPPVRSASRGGTKRYRRSRSSRRIGNRLDFAQIDRNPVHLPIAGDQLRAFHQSPSVAGSPLAVRLDARHPPPKPAGFPPFEKDRHAPLLRRLSTTNFGMLLIAFPFMMIIGGFILPISRIWDRRRWLRKRQLGACAGRPSQGLQQ